MGDYSPWPSLRQCCHELVQELTLLVRSNLLAPAAQVQRILPQCLVAGAQINCQGQSGIWPDTSACSVQRQLANWNAHAVDTKVTKTQDSRAISDDGDLNIVRPIREN